MAALGAAPPPVGRLRRHDLVAAGALIALAALCWWVTQRRMVGMPSDPTTDLGDVGFYTTVWVVMMAAMMFPSAWPVVAMYDRLRSARSGPWAGTALLVGGYLLTWTAWGLAAFGLLRAGRALFGDVLPWDGAGRWVAGAVVLGAAAYQLTPVKDACLVRCRGPLMFVMEHWRPGPLGALRMGAVHGGWCVGCCWALMAALFALGVMNLAWMAVIAALIAIEKLAPRRRAASLAVTAVLAALGIAVLAAPSVVPGLSAGASPAMPMPQMR